MIKSDKATFEGADGQKLAARVDQPASGAKAWAVFAHCFSCSKDIKAAGRIAKLLAASGYGVLRFDFTGLGFSEGDFGNTNFSSNIADLVAAARWLETEHGAPQLLIGHSLGGAAVVAAASRIDSARAVVTIGAPADAEHVLHTFSDDLDAIETNGEAEVALAGRPFTIRKQFLDDVRGAKVREAAAHLGRPLLVLHAPLDQTVGIDNATGLFVSAKHPKSFISLDGADHLLSRAADADFAASTIAAWASRYVSYEQDRSGEAVGADHAIRIEETGNGAYENRVTIGNHAFLSDEPKSVGGGDAGPDPYELVSAGLGACTSMTLRMYADRKDWPLEKVRVRVTHQKDHAADCAECEEGQKVDIFERQIEIQGDLDEVQRSRLLEIADRCPVHRTLHEPVVVRTQLVERAFTDLPN
ncbi:MAG: bifunctional alpha/beta hydrolase/OsmC family protein [Pseudomonadota bacterium]